MTANRWAREEIESVASTPPKQRLDQEDLSYAEKQVSKWNAQEVNLWLFSVSPAYTLLAAELAKLNADGATLLELGPVAWAELGVSSPVEQARLVGLVKRKEDPVARAVQPLACSSSSSGHGTPSTLFSDDLKLAAHLGKATSQTGAENTPYWLLGIANANADPATSKPTCFASLEFTTLLTSSPSRLARSLSLSRTPTTKTPPRVREVSRGSTRSSTSSLCRA